MPDEPSDEADGLPETLDGAHARIRELERELEQESERRYHAEHEQRCFRELAEHIREVFWMTNPLGDELVYISPAYEQIWGQTCDSLYEDPGRRLAWVHDADREAVLKAFKRDAAHGEFDEIYRISRPDGETRWIRDRAFPVYDNSGELYRLAGFALDITDRIEFNDHISNLHTTIDARDRVSVFAALGTGLAHDLSQPLTAARNYIARVRMDTRAADEASADTLARADEQIARAVSIIHHLRDFARQGRPTRKNQALYPIIDDVHQILDPRLRASDVHYHGPAPASLAGLELPMDGIFVQQILRNLLTNAIDCFDEAHETGEGLRKLWVNVASNKHHVDIEVADNGPGVAEGIEIFEPFATTKDEGMGLGLAVSRTLARSHGGELTLVERGGAHPHSRTVFVLRLPRELSGADAAAA